MSEIYNGSPEEQTISFNQENSPFGKIRPIKPGAAYQAEFDSTSSLVPAGLGEWPNEYTFGFPATSEGWTEVPNTSVESVLIKTRPIITLGKKISIERAVLGKALDLFPKDDVARPVRLFGYGMMGENRGYLVTEFLDSYFSSLHDYLLYDLSLPNGGNQLAPQEALTIATQVASIIDRLHANGLGMGDINFEQVFWDRWGKRTRLIDADLGEVEMHSPRHLKEIFNQDKNCLVKILYAAIVGQKIEKIGNTSQDSYDLFERRFPHYQHILRVIKKGLGVEREKYPNTPEGTRQIYRDLLQLLQEVTEQENNK